MNDTSTVALAAGLVAGIAVLTQSQMHGRRAGGGRVPLREQPGHLNVIYPSRQGRDYLDYLEESNRVARDMDTPARGSAARMVRNVRNDVRGRRAAGGIVRYQGKDWHVRHRWGSNSGPGIGYEPWLALRTVDAPHRDTVTPERMVTEGRARGGPVQTPCRHCGCLTWGKRGSGQACGQCRRPK